MRPEELNIQIAMIQEGYHKPPCFMAFLDFKDLLLNPFLVFRRKVILWHVALLYELSKDSVQKPR